MKNAKTMARVLVFVGLSMAGFQALAQEDRVGLAESGARAPARKSSCASALVEFAGIPAERAFSGRDLWVAGDEGAAYGIRISNNCGRRILAVVSVDGVNAVTGETAGTGQGGYVVMPGQSALVEGWRKDMGTVAAFRFSAPGASYASRTGRPDNVGVLGVAFFMEKPEPVFLSDSRANEVSSMPKDSAAGSPAAAPMARMESSRAKAPGGGLGTSHGERLDSPVSRASFERDPSGPFYVWKARYDTRQALVRAGIMPGRQVPRTPEPFPGGFVPDPR